MNQAFLRSFVGELQKFAQKPENPGTQGDQPSIVMMPALPPEVYASLMGEPEEYEEPSMLQMLTPSLGLGAAGLGVGLGMGVGVPALQRRVAPHVAPHLSNLKSRISPYLSRMNPLRFFRKGASESLDSSFFVGFMDELEKSANKDMPSFLRQDRPQKTKEIYRAMTRRKGEAKDLRRRYGKDWKEVAARVASRQGKRGKQSQGPPYKAPIND